MVLRVTSALISFSPLLCKSSTLHGTLYPEHFRFVSWHEGWDRFMLHLGQAVEAGRLFNLPVASFPHLLRGDNVLEGDLPPWDAVRLIDLMPLLLT